MSVFNVSDASYQQSVEIWHTKLSEMLSALATCVLYADYCLLCALYVHCLVCRALLCAWYVHGLM